MNTVGKIFIVLIFLMCTLFMGFTVVMYAAHVNWKAKAEAVQKQFDEAKTENTRIAEEKNRLENELKAEVQRQKDAVTAMTTKYDQMVAENATNKEERDKLADDEQKMVDTINSTHESLADARAQLTQLREDFRKTQADWGTLFTQFVKKTDEAHGLSLQLATYRSVGERLAKDYRDAVDVLRKFSLKPVPEIYSGVPPKGVEGIVTQVRPDGWVEISIGEDSGIMKGHKLDIVRDNRYIGKLEVVAVEPDKAACSILPENRKGTVQVDDKVLNLE